jgi:hypothetical protein
MTMEIRAATDSDIPAIITLLKISLGENLMPKSEAYWKWKHVENPFGRSPVLLCWEGSKLIGVRAFMRWQWTDSERVYKEVRAVDTATHPEYKGKGIFKKLTLSLVDFCSKSGDHFVFNTPNTQSRPGYLKMGWTEAGRLSVKINVNKPLKALKNIIAGGGSGAGEIETESINHYLLQPRLSTLMEVHNTPSKKITTNISPAYLKWRYADVPVVRYLCIGDKVGDDVGELIICRLKHTRIGKELRITDIFLEGKNPSKVLIRQLRDCIMALGVDYCTIADTGEKFTKDLLGHLTLSAAIGPTVTIRSLSMDDLTPLKQFHNWSPSLGDLELF